MRDPISGGRIISDGGHYLATVMPAEAGINFG